MNFSIIQEFQFLDGAIGSQKHAQIFDYLRLFQFLDGAIGSKKEYGFVRNLFRFNSLMVRLVAAVKSCVIQYP